MLSVQIPTLVTPRLRLRKITPEDAPVFFTQLGSSESVTKYMLWKPHKTLEASVASIQKALHRYETGESIRWAITRKDTGQLIGIIDLMPKDTASRCFTFAYMISEDCWGKGYGTESLAAVLDYGFRECRASVIEADHFSDNPASGAVMRKAGMTYIGRIANKYEKNGILYDGECYRITLAQWQKFSKEVSSSDNS